MTQEISAILKALFGRFHVLWLAPSKQFTLEIDRVVENPHLSGRFQSNLQSSPKSWELDRVS